MDDEIETVIAIHRAKLLAQDNSMGPIQGMVSQKHKLHSIRVDLLGPDGMTQLKENLETGFLDVIRTEEVDGAKLLFARRTK